MEIMQHVLIIQLISLLSKYIKTISRGGFFWGGGRVVCICECESFKC